MGVSHTRNRMFDHRASIVATRIGVIMQKVDMSTWGGTKVRNNLKPLWKETQDDAEFGTYQQSLSTGLQNTNELIDEVNKLKAQMEVLKTRPF